VAKRKKPSTINTLLASVRSVADALLRKVKGNAAPRTGAGTAASGSGRDAWREFTAQLEEAFRAQGYQVVQAAGEAPHRSVDIVLRKDRESFLVQCKQWHDPKVSADAVQALHGLVQSRSASGAFIVTTGRFSREAVAYAPGCNIRLIDGAALSGLIAKTKGRISPAAAR
jgi:restriction system protein